MKVTVILLTYKHENFIVQALESVLNQETNFEYDITIIEDFSPDKTRDIVIDYQKKYPDKIRLLLPDHNRNDNLEWMKAIESAQGEYVALLDGDDYWTSPHKLQKQVDFLDTHPECAICFHNCIAFYEDGSQESFKTSPDDQKEISTIEDLFIGSFMPTNSTMFRQGLFGDHFPSWFNELHAGDKPLHILNAQYGNIGYINEVMAASRIHKGGAWHGISNIKQLEVVIKDYQILRANLDVMKNKLTQRQLAEYYFRLAKEYESQGNLEPARDYILKSIIECPLNPLIPKKTLIKLLIKTLGISIINLKNNLIKEQP